MTLEQIIYDIKHLLDAFTDDTVVNDGHLIFKINNYRDIFLHEQLRRDTIINHAFFQKFDKIDVFPVSSGDLPDVDGSIKFGKFTLPEIIHGDGDDEPLLKLYLLQRHKRIYFIDRSQLMEMIFSMDQRLDYTTYYLYEGGNSFYIYPYHENISGDAIFINPLDSKLFYTTSTPIYSIENNIEYIITKGYIKEVTPSGSILGVIYKIGETFTANLNNTYSGDGTIFRTSKVLSPALNSSYPCTGEMAERIILEILTKDFQIERKSVSDILNDSVDQLQVLKGK